MASIILELTVDATMQSLSNIVLLVGTNAYRRYVPVGRGYILPSGLPDALYSSSILPAKRAPSWSPVNVIQVPSILLRKAQLVERTKPDDTTKRPYLLSAAENLSASGSCARM